MKRNTKIMGAIVGDIVGSVYEFNNYGHKDFELFSSGCFATDDSIMTISVAKALMDCNGDYSRLSQCAVSAMQEIGRNYPGCGYGGRFYGWIFNDHPEPYESYGNGAAMRVSPVAYVAETLDEVKLLSEKVTAVSHNHPEGLKGAEATAVGTWMALNGYSKTEIIQEMERYYTLDFTIDVIRPYYRFNETCQQTVPQAIECFKEADGFEDTLRTAISLGGDSDTLSAIACSLAGAYYGVPENIEQKAMTYLDSRLTKIVTAFEEFVV